MEKPLVSIIIVNWNGMEEIKAFIKSLERFEDVAELQIIISDNNSTDGSIEMVREKFPYVEILENKKNIGFGAGNNRAVSLARAGYILFANPDMEFVERGLKKLVDLMENEKDVAACGCMVLNSDGSFMSQCRRGFPDPLTSFYYLSGLAFLFPSILNLESIFTPTCLLIRRWMWTRFPAPFLS